MPITYNGTNITAINYNGTALTKVIFNGTTVWESASWHTVWTGSYVAQSTVSMTGGTSGSMESDFRCSDIGISNTSYPTRVTGNDYMLYGRRSTSAEFSSISISTSYATLCSYTSSQNYSVTTQLKFKSSTVMTHKVTLTTPQSSSGQGTHKLTITKVEQYY